MWHEAQRPRGGALRDGWCCNDATGRKCASAGRGLQECSSVHDLPTTALNQIFRDASPPPQGSNVSDFVECSPAVGRLPHSWDFGTSHWQHIILIKLHHCGCASKVTTSALFLPTAQGRYLVCHRRLLGAIAERQKFSALLKMLRAG